MLSGAPAFFVPSTLGRVDAIYLDGEHYDLLFPHADGADVGFFLHETESARGVVVELACGTGRIAIPLADAGLDVIGVDASDAMLVGARRKASGRANAPRFVHADMRDFALDVPASTIFIGGNSIGHLLTDDDIASCLAAVRRNLVERGAFIVDVFVPSVALLARPSDVHFPFGDYVHPDEGRVVLTQTVAYDPVAQISEAVLWRARDAGPERVGTLRLRMFFPRELQTLLRLHGFAIERAYGDYTRGELNAKSPRQIVVARPA